MKAVLASTNELNHTMHPRAMPLRMRDAQLEPQFKDFSKNLQKSYRGDQTTMLTIRPGTTITFLGLLPSS